jgi:hypothetical protein
VRAAQAKDSTLGPLTKRRRVGAGPALGQDELNCLNLKPRWFLMVPARCGRKTRETERRSQKSRKADENPCTERGNEGEYYSLLLGTTIQAFYTLKGGLCAVKTAKRVMENISILLRSDFGPPGPTPTCVALLGVGRRRKHRKRVRIVMRLDGGVVR